MQLQKCRGDKRMKEILKIKMLGGFSMFYDDREIVLDRNAISKTTQLLQILLLHKETGVAKTSLIDALYGREDVENRNGSLNNTIFRLRKQLRSSGLPEDNYITITGGICYWTGKTPIEVDCLEFENEMQEGDQTDDPEEKVDFYEKASNLYEGEFLPDMIGEDWVAVQNTKDHELYIKCMKTLLIYYQEKEMYEKANCLAARAEEIYPFDEWQTYHIDGLIAMGRYEEAMALYEKTEKLFFEELGISPSKEVVRRFHYMGEHMSQAESALDDIRQRLREKEAADGAYYCNFPSFVDIYHIIVRMMERNGISVFIMLCTIKGSQEGIFGTNEEEKQISRLLQNSIKESLRKGDFYTRYNYGQYLIILSGIAQENCQVVSNRISRKFEANAENGKYSINYYVASAAEVCEDIMQEKENEIWKK